VKETEAKADAKATEAQAKGDTQPKTESKPTYGSSRTPSTSDPRSRSTGTYGSTDPRSGRGSSSGGYGSGSSTDPRSSRTSSANDKKNPKNKNDTASTDPYR